MTQVTVVSDSHLSAGAPEAAANWDAVVEHVTATRPDLVVHAGDLTLDGAHRPDELLAARQQLDRLPVGWRAVPGNHDIGDNPGLGWPSESEVDAARRQRWVDTIGADWWTTDLDDWTLVAVDAQLFGSGLDAEGEQWAWLEETLGEGAADKPIVLVTHKPLTAAETELAEAPWYRFAPPVARRRLTDLIERRCVPLVLSGHVHQFRVLDVGSRRHVWAPTTWAVLPESLQPSYGAKRCGVVELGLAAGGEFDVSMVEPAAMAQLTLLEDLPDPYRR